MPGYSSADGGGNVEGHIHHASGLVVPRASVTLRNTLTRSSRQQVTGDSGKYAYAGLPEGRYSLSVSATGLANETRLGDVAITRHVRLEGAYTLLEGVDRATGLLLPQRHRHQGYAKVDYSSPRWGLLANVRGTLFSKWPLNPSLGTYAYVTRPGTCMPRRSSEQAPRRSAR